MTTPAPTPDPRADRLAARRQDPSPRTATEPAAVNAGAGRSVELRDLHAYYGEQHAVRGVDLTFAPNKVTAIIGPSGCGKSTMVRCINRMHEEIPGAYATGQVLLDGQRRLRARARRRVRPARDRHGLPEAEPASRRCRSSTTSPPGCGSPERRAWTCDERVERSLEGRGPVGRGQGPPRRARRRALRRPAAAPVHRPDDRRRAGRDPDGRAVLGARPDRDAADRGAHRRAQEPLHDRDRHPQHAAGGAGRRRHRVHAHGRAGRGRADRAHLHQPRRRSHRAVRQRASSARAPDEPMETDGPASVPRGARRTRGGHARGPRHGRGGAGARRPRRSTARTSRSRSSSSPTTTGSTAATSRCTRACSACSRGRLRSRPTCGSSPRCCTSSATSSGWATSASTSASSSRSRATTRRSGTRSSSGSTR